MNSKIYRIIDGSFSDKFMSIVYPRSIIVGDEIVPMEDVHAIELVDATSTPRYGWFGGIAGVLTLGIWGSLIGLLNSKDKVKETIMVTFNDGRYVVGEHKS